MIVTRPDQVPGASSHIPVLYHEVLSALDPGAGKRYIDGTLGAGGHTFGLLEASEPDGQVLGIDLDPAALDACRETLADYSERLFLFQGNFAQMAKFTDSMKWQTVDGIILDLGLSSMQLDNANRGFSFQQDALLDMRFDPSQPLTAAELVNSLAEEDLADILWEYGEERFARRIARTIVARRPLQSTVELANLVVSAVPGGFHRIHPATKTFQALRIAVNDELAVLRTALEVGIGLLKPGGRLAVISFHSLEDRIIKQLFMRERRDCICPPDLPVCACDHQASIRLLERKPISPQVAEIENNPRARSAKLRVAEKLNLA
ncbi:MAG: 16S rRNA (cytosine(1402)-N(4))-methyltransferase RsmH [Anaerolineales bacterium]|nr:16S rRNA (cytosine(1402)-N(4))-methyltransferase RsmH [Anaerolineales bacterium]